MLITKKYTQENLINYKNIELSRDSLRGRVLCKNFAVQVEIGRRWFINFKEKRLVDFFLFFWNFLNLS